MRYGFGIDVGGTTIKLAFLDENGTMKDKWEIPTRTEDGGKNVLPDIAASVKEYLEREGYTNDQIIGIGIGVPGPVSDAGIVNKCVNLGWGIIDLHGELSVLTGLNVKGGNDANVAALGECWKGGGQGAKDMVMATLGTGVGGGIVVGGNQPFQFFTPEGNRRCHNADCTPWKAFDCRFQCRLNANDDKIRIFFPQHTDGNSGGGVAGNHQCLDAAGHQPF